MCLQARTETFESNQVAWQASIKIQQDVQEAVKIQNIPRRRLLSYYKLGKPTNATIDGDQTKVFINADYRKSRFQRRLMAAKRWNLLSKQDLGKADTSDD